MLACQYKIVVRPSWRKNKIASTVIEKLVEQEIIDESAHDLCDDSDSLLELKKLELEAKERESERKEREKEKERQEKEKERQEREKERQAKERESERQAKENFNFLC